MSIYARMPEEKIEDYFLLSSAVMEIFNTVPNAKAYDTPLGIFFEVRNGGGFYLSDINIHKIEPKLVSYRIYGEKDLDLLMKRVFQIKGLVNVSPLLNRRELNIKDIKEYFNEYI